MPGVEILSAPQHDVFHRQPLIQQQQIVHKNQNSKEFPYIPPEIIRMILCLLKDDKKTLSSCALVNHTFNLHVTPILYHSISFSLPFSFVSFANTINSETQRSRLVRRLDLSGLSTIGLQKNNNSDAIEKVITQEFLISILKYCTMLETFSISEHLELSITSEVLNTLFKCQNIKTLDFCGLTNKQCDSAFSPLAESLGKVQWSLTEDYDNYNLSFQKSDNVKLSHIQRLSLHGCSIISESSIITLLSHSPNLTHLDLGGCSISDITLNFILNETNLTNTLTHLLLAKCKNISSEGISDLIVKCKKLQVLNLYDLITPISEYDLIAILTSPYSKNFKTLNIGSSNITHNILYNIQENCSNLEFLGISKAKIRSISYLIDFLNELPNIKYIDISGISCLNFLNIQNFLNDLRVDHSLHTIEINEPLFKTLGNINEWKKIDNYNRRRWYYAKESSERPDKVHPRKLDVAEYGSDKISKIFDYYSFSV